MLQLLFLTVILQLHHSYATNGYDIFIIVHRYGKNGLILDLSEEEAKNRENLRVKASIVRWKMVVWWTLRLPPRRVRLRISTVVSHPRVQ